MPHLVVAIPVRDEVALIGDCLRALALQQGRVAADILLLVNNSTDGTAEFVRGLLPTLPCQVHVIEHHFPPAQANAGSARRLAMRLAAERALAGGVVMCTDADGCVGPDWLEGNLSALQAGADVVCGRAVINPVDALRIPRHLHDDDMLEVAFGTALDRISDRLDPDPADPWPRHTEESGASIAVWRDTFLRAGGVPNVTHAEDRALVDALRRVDARVRHAPNVCVTVSGRIVGRATGGMADTIRRRIVRQDDLLDSALEPVSGRVRRVTARRSLRLAWRSGVFSQAVIDGLCARLAVDAGLVRAWLALPCFGAAWASAEAASSRLARLPVKREDVGSELAAARAMLAGIEGDRGCNLDEAGGRISV